MKLVGEGQDLLDRAAEAIEFPHRKSVAERSCPIS
jgi:hypothetical protein